MTNSSPSCYKVVRPTRGEVKTSASVAARSLIKFLLKKLTDVERETSNFFRNNLHN